MLALNDLTANNIQIPARTANLLYVSDADPTGASVQGGLDIRISLNIADGRVEVGELSQSDPSTIFTQLPIKKPRSNQVVPELSYYPTYKGLTPQQRWLYLNWLKDISQPINIGYVFVYYYGLERRLLTGEASQTKTQSLMPKAADNSLVKANAFTEPSNPSSFETAFEEVIRLQQFHKSSSFAHYSHAALTHACIYQKRLDKLEELYKSDTFLEVSNIDLLVAYHAGIGISPHNLMRLPKKVSGFYKKKLKIDESDYEGFVSKRLMAKYGESSLPIKTLFRTSELPKNQEILFANISFPSSFRTQSMPSFFLHKPFQDHVMSVFIETDKEVQAYLQANKKRKA